MTWDELFDGEVHTLVAGVDFSVPDRRWDPDLAEYRALTAEELRSFAVADGWAVTAIRLKTLAEAMGGRGAVLAKGKQYLFRYLPEGSKESTWLS